MLTGRVQVGVFDSGEALLAAARECSALGVGPADAFTPCPVHGLDEALGIARSRLPFVTLAGGVVGLALALGFQYWASASNWPLDVGGKPFDSLPAFVPVAFELLVLLAGLATAAALLFRSRLFPGSSGGPPDPRVTDDRYVLVVSRTDAAVSEEQLAELCTRHGAVQTWSEYRP